jgi:tRNA(Arg) A34 adenosine deaminase TadA
MRPNLNALFYGIRYNTAFTSFFIYERLPMTKDEILKTGWFLLARTSAMKVNFRHKVGSVLVRKGTPVSVGRNHPTKTHPLIRKYSAFKTIHAEFDAIIGIDRLLAEGSNMYIYRELADGSVACAKPCAMCLAFLQEMQVRKIYYTVVDGYEMITL